MKGEIVSVGESKTYTFASVADETVSITAQQTSALLDACWELYDPEGISVVGACGQATKTLAVPGNYTIRVSDNGNNQTGTFNLDLVFVSDTGSSCAEGLVCGDALPREITNPVREWTVLDPIAYGEDVYEQVASKIEGLVMQLILELRRTGPPRALEPKPEGRTPFPLGPGGSRMYRRNG